MMRSIGVGIVVVAVVVVVDGVIYDDEVLAFEVPLKFMHFFINLQNYSYCYVRRSSSIQLALVNSLE